MLEATLAAIGGAVVAVAVGGFFVLSWKDISVYRQSGMYWSGARSNATWLARAVIDAARWPSRGERWKNARLSPSCDGEPSPAPGERCR